MSPAERSNITGEQQEHRLTRRLVVFLCRLEKDGSPLRERESLPPREFCLTEMEKMWCWLWINGELDASIDSVVPLVLRQALTRNLVESCMSLFYVQGWVAGCDLGRSDFWNFFFLQCVFFFANV